MRRRRGGTAQGGAAGWIDRGGAAAALAALVLGSAGGTAAQVSPNGAELQVNAYTTGHQREAAAAMDSQGNFVVVWESDGSSGTDADGYSIQGRRYDAHGVPLGAQFQVNTYTTFHQYDPGIAMAPGGAFVVVWTSNGSSGSDSNDYSIQARRFGAAGAPLGSEFQVNTYTTIHQSGPGVAIDAAGDFVVVWESNGSSGTDISTWSTQARRYDAAGVPLGGQFQVNTYTTNEQENPAVAMNAGGAFVVAWESNGSDFTDTSGYCIRARRYDSTGVALENDFQVNELTTLDQRDASVAIDGTGNFVAVWRTASANIKAQRFSPAGGGAGEFQVNTYATSTQGNPTVAAEAAGGFVVAWSGLGSSGTDDSSNSVQAKLYDAAALPRGEEFQVNTYTTSSQKIAAVGMNGGGDFVVAWESDGSSGTDTSGSSVHAQRFDGLFRDGFESGTTGRWPISSP